MYTIYICCLFRFLKLQIVIHLNHRFILIVIINVRTREKIILKNDIMLI